MPIPYVVLFCSDASAELALAKTEAVLGEFPGLRVLAVTLEAGRKTDRIREGSAPLQMGGIPKRFIGIYAATRIDDLPDFLRLVAPNPLIFVPVADSPKTGLRLIQDAASCGAPTVALGETGAMNAALLAISLWAAGSGAGKLRKSLDAFRARQTAAVRKMKLPAT